MRLRRWLTGFFISLLFWLVAEGLAAWPVAPALVGDLKQGGVSAKLMDLGPGTHVLEGALHVGGWRPKSIRVSADDCLMSIVVAGKELFSTPRCTFCANCSSKILQLPDLPAGIQPIKVVTQDRGGTAWVQIGTSREVFRDVLILSSISGALLILIGMALRIRKLLLLIVLGAQLIAIPYVLGTNPFQRDYDIEGHLQYVDILRQSHRLPLPTRGWETYHPPAYYALGALITSDSPTPLRDDPRLLARVQLIALASFSAALILTLFLIGRYRELSELHYLGLLLFGFIPGHLFFISRINNDAPVPLLGVASFALAWAYEKKSRFTVALLGGVVGAIAVMVKYSALPLLGAFCLWVLFRSTGRPWIRLRNTLAAALPGAITIFLWARRSHQLAGNWMYSNAASISGTLRIPNDFRRYFYFDLPRFLSEGGVTTHSGEGRLSLWSTCLTTLLQGGEHPVADSLLALVTFMRASFLVLLVAIAIGLCKGWRKRTRLTSLAMLYIGVHLIFFLLFNWRQPYSSSQDARYLGSAFFALAIVASVGIESALDRGSVWLRRLAQIGLLGYLPLLGIFYLSLLYL